MQTANGATLRAEVLGFCRKNTLFSAEDRVCVAVSGGADSVALLLLLRELSQELKISLSAAHFDHRLRGGESTRDAAFVEALCRRLSIPLHPGCGDVQDFAQKSGLSVETAARHLRYAFFESLDCDCIATAHHADDNAETVLLHLLRGTGLRGLSGIPARRGRFVRPLLGVSRVQLENYLREIGQDWVQDSTNALDDAARNRLRHHIMPLLGQESPDFARRLAARSAVLREEDAYLDSLAAALVQHDRDGWRIAPILSAPPVLQRRALRQILATVYPQDVSLAHIEALRALLENANPSAQLSLPNGCRAERRYEHFRLVRDSSAGFSPVRLSTGETVLDNGLRIFCTHTEKIEKIVNFPFLFCVSCAMIQESGLVARPRRTGDRLMLPNGTHTTVKKRFIDLKIPRAERDALPVFEADGAVLAVAALGASFDALPKAGQAAWIIQITEKEEISHA